MKVDLHNISFQKAGTFEVPDEVFQSEWKPNLVHQVFISILANRRVPVAHTKGRSEVRGGGRKPWRQKGTGRARHGSIRSPLWRGGGVTFGPTAEKQYARKITKRMKRTALYSLLSKKMERGEIVFFDSFALPEYKTKTIAALLTQSELGTTPSILFVASSEHKDLHRAARNVPRVEAVAATSLNVYDCLAHQHMFIEKDAVQEFLQQYQTEHITA